METKYPEELLRGISSANDITPEGYVMAGAFKFDEYDPNYRNDGWCELSINWNDDSEALQVLLDQHKPGKDDKQFKAGYCKLRLSTLHIMFKQYIDDNNFFYERQPIDASEENDNQANPYHGNLLMQNSLTKNAKKNLQHALATLAGTAIPREK